MRIIKLSRGLSLYDIRTPFPVGNLDLYIDNLPKTSGDFRFIAFMNGTKIVEQTITQNSPRINIPRETINAWVFSCYVSHYVGGDEVHRYEVEPLIITDINTDLSATPELVELNKKISGLENALAMANSTLEKASTKITALTEELASTNVAVLKLLKWMYSVETQVPYLAGGTAEEFAAALGLELTADELSFIGGLSNEKD